MDAIDKQIVKDLEQAWQADADYLAEKIKETMEKINTSLAEEPGAQVAGLASGKAYYATTCRILQRIEARQMQTARAVTDLEEKVTRILINQSRS